VIGHRPIERKVMQHDEIRGKRLQDIEMVQSRGPTHGRGRCDSGNGMHEENCGSPKAAPMGRRHYAVFRTRLL
jgi:hypothetical protein